MGPNIYFADAYVAQTSWLPPVYNGLKSLSTYIEKDNDILNFFDINQAARDASSFGSKIYAVPFDTKYIALGWRQDVFELHKDYYKENYGEDLTVPRTIEDLVIVSERLNGLDHNGDGEPDFGFCISPQTKYFYAFLAPILQTHLHECHVNTDGTFDCDLRDRTEQNIFFDVDTFEPLIHNVR